MATISLCMIVKNEEKVLARCLDSLSGLMDEMIIVDTGSVDRTKEIAARYTDKIYDFAWTGNFADARNYADSLATMEYIYTADADEVIDGVNRERFRLLKEALLPEVEMVQMYYCNILGENNTTNNFEKEYRPKLYRRLRRFTWIDPIHETLRLDPVVFDSDIEIQHRPEGNHSSRDLEALRRAFMDEGCLSSKLHHMYAMELFIAGGKEDFDAAEPVFLETLEQTGRSMDEIKEAVCVLVRIYRERGDEARMLAYALKDAVTMMTAEVCCELGAFYEAQGDLAEAKVWYGNAASDETESILDIRTSHEIPLQGMMRLS